jgi:hypothetical protein
VDESIFVCTMDDQKQEPVETEQLIVEHITTVETQDKIADFTDLNTDADVITIVGPSSMSSEVSSPQSTNDLLKTDDASMIEPEPLGVSVEPNSVDLVSPTPINAVITGSNVTVLNLHPKALLSFLRCLPLVIFVIKEKSM